MVRYFFIVMLVISFSSVFKVQSQANAPISGPAAPLVVKPMPTKPQEPKSHGQVINFEDFFGGNKASKEVAETAFSQYILQNPLPVVVKFFMQGCGQCESVKSLFNSLAHDYAGRISFIDIDINKFNDLAESKEVKSLPTVLYMSEGAEKGRATGPQVIQQIRNHLKEHFEIS